MLSYDYELFSEIGEMVDEDVSPAKPKVKAVKAVQPRRSFGGIGAAQDWQRSREGFADFDIEDKPQKHIKKKLIEQEEIVSPLTTQEIDDYPSDEEKDFVPLNLDDWTPSKQIPTKKITNRKQTTPNNNQECASTNEVQLNRKQSNASMKKLKDTDHKATKNVETNKISDLNSRFTEHMRARLNDKDSSEKKLEEENLIRFSELMSKTKLKDTLTKQNKSTDSAANLKPIQTDVGYMNDLSAWKTRSEVSDQNVTHFIDSCSPQPERKKPSPKDAKGMSAPPQAIFSQTATISDYESEAEEPVSLLQNDDGQNNKDDENSPDIDTALSTGSAAQPNASKRRASDWVRGIQLKAVTPEKDAEEAYGENAAAQDSAKKKKQKYTKGGFADRLSRLISRQKSAMAFWNHKSNNNHIKHDTAKCLEVYVLRVQLQWLSLLARCRVTSPGMDSQAGEVLTVVFHSGQAKQLKIQQSSQLRIHPPWQRLSAPGVGPVILCTQFCQLIQKAGEGLQPEQTPSVTSVTSVWSCVCSQDPHYRPSECPVAKESCDQKITLPTQGKAQRQAAVAEASEHLNTVSNSQSQSGCDSILRSIERCGGHSATGVTFQAVVQRVFCKRLTHGGSIKWWCLMQDVFGCFCQVELPDVAPHRAPWQQLLEAEGRLVRFSGLRVQHRLNKDRVPGLFSLMQSVWRPDVISAKTMESQESQGSGVGPLSQMPGFCYSLACLHGESSCTIPDTPEKGLHSLYTQPQISCLRSLVQQSGSRVWVHCMARVIHQTQESSSSQECWYVTDESLQAGHSSRYTDGPTQTMYIPVYVRASCHVPDSVRESLSKPRPVAVIKDSVYHSGSLYLDSYSQVCNDAASACRWTLRAEAQHEQRLRQLPVRLPSFDLINLDTLTCRTLVSVSGTVCGVDEDTAYSWLVCDTCGSDKLTESPSDMYCEGCQKNTDNPVTQICLEIFLNSNNLDAPPVKIKLLQPTIESLLPPEVDDEGYDVQCILGQQVSGLSCIVTDIRQGETVNRDIKLQEISISNEKT